MTSIEKINLISAWLSFVLMLSLSLPWLTRILVTKKKVKKLSSLNKVLHIHHKKLFLLCVATVVIHLISSLIYVNYIPILGIILIVLFLILTLTGVYKKRLTTKWLLIHKYTTLLTLLVLIAHVIVEIPN